MSMVELRSRVAVVVPNSEVPFLEISRNVSLVPAQAPSVGRARWPAVALLIGGVLSAVWCGLLCTGVFWLATELLAML